MTITGCDWRDVFLDQQQHVRHGTHSNSYWHVDVAHAGTYRIELRRWPEEAELALNTASPATQLTDGALSAGIALPIGGARIHIGTTTLQITTQPDDQSATFTVQLPAGPTELHTWFLDTRNEPITGAYYASIERLAAAMD